MRCAAECTSLRQLRGEHRFVRHEMLKAQNSLVMMVLKMCGTGIFVRKHAVSTPQVCTSGFVKAQLVIID